jgi:hypothetical protein
LILFEKVFFLFSPFFCLAISYFIFCAIILLRLYVDCIHFHSLSSFPFLLALIASLFSNLLFMVEEFQTFASSILFDMIHLLTTLLVTAYSPQTEPRRFGWCRFDTIGRHVVLNAVDVARSVRPTRGIRVALWAYFGTRVQMFRYDLLPLLLNVKVPIHSK